MSRFVFLVQARTGSSRHPNKVLTELYDNYRLIDIVLYRLGLVGKATDNDTYVLTTTEPLDDKLVAHLKARNIAYYRGVQENVYERFRAFLTGLPETPEYFFRICGDNPFIDPLFIEQMMDASSKKGMYEYISYINDRGVPAIGTHLGLFCELIKTSAFMGVANEIRTDFQREHVTPIFYQQRQDQCFYLPMPVDLTRLNFRLTIDTPMDMQLAKDMLRKLGGLDFSFNDIVQCFDNNPDLLCRSRSLMESSPK